LSIRDIGAPFRTPGEVPEEVEMSLPESDRVVEAKQQTKQITWMGFFAFLTLSVVCLCGTTCWISSDLRVMQEKKCSEVEATSHDAVKIAEARADEARLQSAAAYSEAAKAQAEASKAYWDHVPLDGGR
jgi:uncharacterized iron-regulated membrane protein